MSFRQRLGGSFTALLLTLLNGTAAQAFDTIEVFPLGSPNFNSIVNPDGSISASLSHTNIDDGTFQDTFTFTLDFDGTATGTFTTSASTLFSPLDLDFTNVFVNGQEVKPGKLSDGLVEFANFSALPVATGPFINTIVVEGLSRGNGSYGANLTLYPSVVTPPTEPVPGVPEPASWAMLLTGFGAVGWGMRRKGQNAGMAPLA